MSKPKIKIIISSTRPNRVGPTIAKWVMSAAEKRTNATYELVDLKEIDLPLFNEANPPSAAPAENEHAKAWANIVGEADGFIFVHGEYNHGIQPSLKNAIDYLYHEWRHKPVAFVSYGADAGGIRATEHLRQVVGWLDMHDLGSTVSIPNYWTQMDENHAFTANDHQVEKLDAVLTNIAFWSDALIEPRNTLAEK
jgi:NAD(P)H-dependent FMN reductase